MFCGQDLGTRMSTQVTTTNTPICATMLHVVVVVVVVVAPHGAARVGIHNPLSGHLFVIGVEKGLEVSFHGSDNFSVAS